jgi:uncharacterized membrane protein YfcA
MYELLALFGAGLIGGIVNSVAGGGNILMYPLLFSLGLPPVMTNATIAASIWPGALSSAYGYRKEINKIPRYYFALLLPCLIGAIVGASILRKTPDRNFQLIVPWLVLMAVILLSLQPKIHEYIKKKQKKRKNTNVFSLALIFVAFFFVAVYGGYFGAGFGIIVLALLGFTKLTDIHQMNGLKNLTGACISIVVTIYFIHYKLIDWHYIPPMLVGAVIGGYLGSTYSHKLPTYLIRKIIIISGVAVAIYLFVKY